MKKIIFLLITITVLAGGCLAGCSYEGYDFVDTNYHFNRAYISMPYGEVIEVDIRSWADSEDGEQLTITAKDGTRYLVHSANCVLIEDK